MFLSVYCYEKISYGLRSGFWHSHPSYLCEIGHNCLWWRYLLGKPHGSLGKNPWQFNHLPPRILQKILTLLANAYHSYTTMRNHLVRPPTSITTSWEHLITMIHLHTLPMRKGKEHRRNRKRKIIWFNPPCCSGVKTNIAKDFLRAIDKHCPLTNPLHRLFNRNTIRLTVANVRMLIQSHNREVLQQARDYPEPQLCNCRVRNDCPDSPVLRFN